MRGLRVPLALVLLLGIALPALARVVHVYEPRHRVAAELAPLVETVLGAEGRVIVDARTNALVLAGEADAVRGALDLLRQMDVRLRTVVLHYASDSLASLASRGVRVDWRVDAGDLRVGTLRGEGSALAVRVDETRTDRDGGRSAQLRILEGESGRIATGELVPFRTREVFHGPRGTAVRESAHWIGASSGLEATPRVLGDGRVELALRPFDDRLESDGRVTTAGAETRLVLEPGETVVLGGIAGSESGRQRDLSGAAAAEETRDRVLRIRASVE